MTARPMLFGLALSVASAVAPAASPARQSAGDQSDRTMAARIEALVRPQADADLFSGIVLVANGSRMLFERPYGFANWELRAPNSPSTRFAVGSITKEMTETLVHLLAAAGRIDLDTPVERYLPGFPRGPRGGRPTVRQLLTHRAGVPHRVTSALDETQVLHPRDIVERVRATGLLFEPGTRRLYSSGGYTCLARVVEVVEGKPFDEVLADRVFRPAGMTSAVGETGENLMPRRAMPYRLGAAGRRVVVKSAPYKDLRFLTGAGSVYATAGDLLHFVRALRAGVFGADFAEEMVGAGPAWHGWYGRTNDYEASVDVLPSRDVTFVLFSNLASAATWQLREQIRHVIAGGAGEPIPLPPPVAAPFEDPASLVGSYGPAEITLVDGSLFRGDNEFYPVAGRQYYIPASGFTMRFRRDAAGAVDALVSVAADGHETVLRRTGR